MKEKNKKVTVFSRRSLFATFAVIVGVMIITLVMNLIMPDNDTDIDEQTMQEAIAQSKISDKDDGLISVYNEETKTVSSTALPNSEASDKSDAETKSDEDLSKQENSSKTIYTLPVDGAVIKDYSEDELQYSETMSDWRVHLGIDFAANEGTDVMAAADGVIEKSQKDGMLGTCVVIAHSDGTKTIYGNLQENSGLSENTTVKAGEIIGKVGKTAALEILEQPHLHFEVISQNKNINPHDFFDEEKLTTAE